MVAVPNTAYIRMSKTIKGECEVFGAKIGVGDKKIWVPLQE